MKTSPERMPSQNVITGETTRINYIDPDLFDIFIREKVYEQYAKFFLNPDQTGDINFSEIPGYRPPPKTISRP